MGELCHLTGNFAETGSYRQKKKMANICVNCRPERWRGQGLLTAHLHHVPLTAYPWGKEP